VADLKGKRVIITRPRHQAAALSNLLSELGALPLCVPTIEIAPLANPINLDAALRDLKTYDWVILTSVNGVRAMWERLEQLGIVFPQDGPRVAVIGPKTASAMDDRGISPDFVPDEYIAEAILPGLEITAGSRVLLLRADIARPTLAEAIKREGGIADDVAVYRTLPAAIDASMLAEIHAGVDVITFTSSSTVTYFVTQLVQLDIRPSEIPGDPLIACIGPITAATARSHGLRVDVMPDEYTIEGLVEALISHPTVAAKEVR
jgi:uroporphyrinogen-III synthase